MCPGILLVNREKQTASSDEAQSQTQLPLFPPLEHPQEETTVPVDSIWEMELPPIDTAVWEEDDSPYSEESVLE